MIKDRKKWQELKESYSRRKQPDFQKNLKLFEVMYQEARWLKILPANNPLQGINHKIAFAKRLNISRITEKVATAPEKKQIPYMLIGRQAVVLYGEPRLTRHIDVALDAGVDRLTDLLELVQELKWKVLVQDPDVFVKQTMVLHVLDPETQIRMDFIFSCTSYEHQAMQRVWKVKIEDVRGTLLKNPDILHWLTQFEESLQQPFVIQFEKLWRETKA